MPDFWLYAAQAIFPHGLELRTTGWEWVKITATPLKPGEHTLTMAYREDGALLDKICVTSYAFGPTGLEEIDGKGKAGKE